MSSYVYQCAFSAISRTLEFHAEQGDLECCDMLLSLMTAFCHNDKAETERLMHQFAPLLGVKDCDRIQAWCSE